jgi:hypothetical protein
MASGKRYQPEQAKDYPDRQQAVAGTTNYALVNSIEVPDHE